MPLMRFAEGEGFVSYRAQRMIIGAIIVWRWAEDAISVAAEAFIKVRRAEANWEECAGGRGGQ
jgi:hypothetical protein